MANPTTATCVYTATTTGVSTTAMNAALAAVPLDTDFLNMLGLTVASDTTINSVRTIVLNLTAAYYAQMIPANGPPDPMLIGDWMLLRLQGTLKVPIVASPVTYA